LRRPAMPDPGERVDFHFDSGRTSWGIKNRLSGTSPVSQTIDGMASPGG
jgi:hypothetical protein